MRRRGSPLSHLLVPIVLLACAAGRAAWSAPVESSPAPTITILSDDYPDYKEVVGTVRLAGIDPAVLGRTDPQYLRLALADSEKVPHIPASYWVYQTVSTGVDLPVSVNLVVNGNREAWCFNPDIPYCSPFTRLNELLTASATPIETLEQAGSRARFIVEMGTSHVHHPGSFLYFRLSQKIPLEHHNFLAHIDEIYEEGQAPFRSEAMRAEVARVIPKYRDVVRAATLASDGDGFRFHGYVYKVYKDGGPLREWDILVRRNGTADVTTTLLEEHVGELSWPFAP